MSFISIKTNDDDGLMNKNNNNNKKIDQIEYFYFEYQSVVCRLWPKIEFENFSVSYEKYWIISKNQASLPMFKRPKGITFYDLCSFFFLLHFCYWSDNDNLLITIITTIATIWMNRQKKKEIKEKSLTKNHHFCVCV